MESHRLRAGVGILGIILVTSALPAAAVDRDMPSTHAETDGNGVDVIFSRHDDGHAAGQPRQGTSSCHWSAVRVDPVQVAPVGLLSPQPSPEATPWMLYCDDEYRGMRWLQRRDFTDGPVLDQLEQRIHELVVQPAGMEVRPGNRGITGIPSLFWVAGYDGQPVQATFTEFGLTVAVTARLAGTEWDFGDGTPRVQGSLGEAYPQRSSVRHAYRDVSGEAPYTVTARLIFQPTYTVNGAPGAVLDPIVVPITRPYVVHQVQAMRRR
jgi:hypothetical protein